MGTVRIVSGTGIGPTRTASYDAALADANVHEYNLVRISSVVPESARIETVDRAPDLGPPGHQLWVVQARDTDSRAAAAGMAWAKPPDRSGIIYEATGTTDRDALRDELDRGLDAGLSIRSMRADGDHRGYEISVAPEPDSGFATAVVLAVYGDGRPIL